ncbi:MAG: hypothetical protein ACLGIG_00680 [Actinomycetes bacterium]
MDAARLARAAAVAAVVLWGAKAIAIWVAGGLDESPLEGPLFFLGLLAAVTAGGAIGAALTHGRATGVRVAAAVAGVLAGAALGALADALSRAVLPDSTGWVQAEAGLWLSALVLVAVAFLVLPRRRAPDGPA